jgi:hypothetical protein
MRPQALAASTDLIRLGASQDNTLLLGLRMRPRAAGADVAD